MLSGLRSPCTTPCSWAACRPRPTPSSIGNRASHEGCRRSTHRRRVNPSTSSITTCTVFGGVAHGGSVLLDASLPIGEYGALLAAPLRHTPSQAPTNVASMGLPISAQTRVEPGCVGLQPFVDGDAEGDLGVLHVVTRSVSGALGGRLSLELVRVGDIGLEEEDLDVAVEHAQRIYANAGAGPIEVSRYRVEAPEGSVFPSMGPELAALRAGYEPRDPQAMVVFLIDDFVEPGLAGIAAGLPGPNGIPGTGASGVVVAVEPHRFGDGSLAATIFGETLAHEVGHQLGLFHTSEQDASNHDFADDTAVCTLDMDTDGDGTLNANECPDGQNLMFWGGSEFPQVELSPAQADVLIHTTIAR